MAQIRRRMVGLCGVGGRITVRCAVPGQRFQFGAIPIMHQVTPGFAVAANYRVAEYMKRKEENLDEF